MSAWIIVSAGVVIYFISTRIPPPRKQNGVRISRCISFLGFGILVVGIYAGMKGPVVLGNTTVAPFSFAHAIQKSDAEAFSYARNHVSLSSRPAGAWQGASKDSLKCTVTNSGEKSIRSITFRFITDTPATVDRSIRGPYPPGSTKNVLVSLPDSVSRSYFEAPGMTANQICGASF